MTRKRTERPVERLRSGWTSTDDLEETIAAMFKLPPDNLTGGKQVEPPDKLSGATAQCDRDNGLYSDSFSSSAPDKLAVGLEAYPPDVLDCATPVNLSGGQSDGSRLISPDKLTGDGTDNLTAGSPDTLSATTTLAVAIPPLDSLAEVHSDPSDPVAPIARLVTAPAPALVNLTGAPTDNLTVVTSGSLGSATKFTSSPAAPGNLPVPVASITPPDNLTGPTFETLDGLIVDAKCIRLYQNVQSAHTASEHLVYTTMWKLLGSREDDGPSREGLLPMAAVASKVSISLRNLRRVLRSLEQKFALEITEYEDKTRSIPRRYRVWGFRPTMERRRHAGYSYIYRNRNLITLARPSGKTPPDTLAGAAAVNLSGAPPASLTSGPPDSLAPNPGDNKAQKPPDNMAASLIKEESKLKPTTSSPFAVSPVIAMAVTNNFGYVDDDALRRMIRACRQSVPDATDDEIADLATSAAHRIRRMRNLVNPVGLLITQVPKYFEGQSFLLYREEKRRVQEAERQRLRQQQREAQAILDNPASDNSDREWAQTLLQSIGDELSNEPDTQSTR